MAGAKDGSPGAMCRIDSTLVPGRRPDRFRLGGSLWLGTLGHGSSGNRERRLYSQIVAKSARGWSRDGKRIAFAAVADENIDVYAVDVESTQVTRLTSSPVRTVIVMVAGRYACRVLIHSRWERRNLRDASRWQRCAACDEQLWLRYKPNVVTGRVAIAFVSDRDGTWDLYAMRPDGHGLTRLTVGAGVTKDVPRWAPDTSRIAFQIARGDNYDMGIVRISPQEADRLCELFRL